MAQTRHLTRVNKDLMIPEWEVSLERIAGGSTVEIESERLGISVHSLYTFFKRDADRYNAYQEALETRAETVHDMQYSYAKDMVQRSHEMEKDQILALDKGMAHLDRIKRFDHKRFRPDTSKAAQLTPEGLKDFLAQLDAAQKAKAIEEKTIEADFTAQDAPELAPMPTDDGEND